ncbi:MAG TPA: hypothetical protein VKA08_12005 [Balneolales bacterium]|nr:hypothetical protein [Balneolales bacterium]
MPVVGVEPTLPKEHDFVTRHSIPAKDVLRGIVEIPPGTLEIWEHGSTIHGHIGSVISWERARGEAVEGNTHPEGHKEPQGVWIRYRDIIPSDYFRIRWFTLVTYR